MYIFGTDLDNVVADLEQLLKHEHIVELEKTDIAELLLSVVLPVVYPRLPVVPGAKECLRRIKEIPAKIVIVTARSSEDEKLTRDWLEEKGILYDEIHFVGHGGDKSIVTFDCFVDDYPENLEKIKSRKKLLFDKPWNRECNDFPRVYTWDEIYVYVREDARGRV